MTRLYLGGFKFSHRQEPSLPSREELTSRFGNVQEVEQHEYYVHFTLPNDDLEVVKKLKAKYNGATWKGSKVRLEVAKAKKQTNLEVNEKKKVKRVRRLVRHCGDMSVVCDVSGKVRKGWVRSKGGRHVIQEVKIRKPDGKVKTIDLNALYKKNILILSDGQQQQQQAQEAQLLENIWSTHGYDLKPTISKPVFPKDQITTNDSPITKDPSTTPKDQIITKAERPKNLPGKTLMESTIVKKQETKNICKWSDAFNTKESVLFSIFPTPKSAVIQEEPDVQQSDPQENILGRQVDLQFTTQLPPDADTIVRDFVNLKMDIYNWKRTIRPLLRKDIKQQRKQHIRTFRKVTKK